MAATEVLGRQFPVHQVHDTRAILSALDTRYAPLSHTPPPNIPHPWNSPPGRHRAE